MRIEPNNDPVSYGFWGQHEKQGGALFLSESHEQRWKHKAGWSFPALSLGLQATLHTVAVQCLCVLSCCWGQREASVTATLAEFSGDHCGLTVFKEGP